MNVLQAQRVVLVVVHLALQISHGVVDDEGASKEVTNVQIHGRELEVGAQQWLVIARVWPSHQDAVRAEDECIVLRDVEGGTGFAEHLPQLVL